MRVCPGLIAMAIHYYVTPGPYSPDNPEHANSDAVYQWHKILMAQGLLRPYDHTRDQGREYRGYMATDAMGVWIDALCKVPFPVQQWVIPGADK